MAPPAALAAFTVAVLAIMAAAPLMAAAAPSSRGDGRSVTAVYRQMDCKVDEVLSPNSTEEVAAAIAARHKQAAAKNTTVKIRATHRYFHSTSSFPCPSTYELKGRGRSWVKSPRADVAVVLVLHNMHRVLGFEPASNQIRVQAGMTVQQLMEAAGAVNSSSPLGALPAFAGITLGGALATNAHGTGHNTTSTLCDIVVELVWVDGQGQVHTSSRDSAEGRALCGGLGIVGVVTELVLALAARSHTIATAAHIVPDADLMGDIRRLIKDYPHTLVIWRPDLQKYTAHSFEEVPTSTPSTGATAAVEVPPSVAGLLGQALGGWQKDIENKKPFLEDIIGAVVMQTSLDRAWATSPDGKPLFTAVGDTNHMQAVSCGQQCIWEAAGADVSFDDLHFTIELEQLPSWIDDVRAVMQKDFWTSPDRLGKMLPPGYFWLRFGRGNQDLLSPNAGLKAPAHVQMSFMRSYAFPGVPGKYSWLLEAIEQLTICKYRGRPHWGKNTERTYTHPSCPIRRLYPSFDQLLQAQSRHDPLKLLEPHLFARMAAEDGPAYGPGCVLRGECFCRADIHCPSQYRCVPSFAFPEYNVCKPRVTF